MYCLTSGELRGFAMIAKPRNLKLCTSCPMLEAASTSSIGHEVIMNENYTFS